MDKENYCESYEGYCSQSRYKDYLDNYCKKKKKKIAEINVDPRLCTSSVLATTVPMTTVSS